MLTACQNHDSCKANKARATINSLKKKYILECLFLSKPKLKLNWNDQIKSLFGFLQFVKNDLPLFSFNVREKPSTTEHLKSSPEIGSSLQTLYDLLSYVEQGLDDMAKLITIYFLILVDMDVPQWMSVPTN